MTEYDPLECDWIMLGHPGDWQDADKSEESKAELSRRAQALSDGQKKPFEDKLVFAHKVLDKALTESDSWYNAFSAGNDSHVTSHMLAHTFKSKTPNIMSNTRLEWPETIRNAARWRPVLESFGVSLHVAYPEIRPGELWDKYGVPLFSKMIASKYQQWYATDNEAHIQNLPDYVQAMLRKLRAANIKLTDKCCDELKKKPLKKMAKKLGVRNAITGSRAAESQARRLAYIQRGALYESTRHNQMVANPLVHWTAADIAEYHALHGIEVEQIPTRKGRSGCVNCGFGCHLDDENNLQILARRNPKMWAKTMDDWKFREACDVAGVRTEPLLLLFDKFR